MLFSAKLVHGRSIPLRGESFENMFVHFMPAAANTGNWFQSDFLPSFGKPLKQITLDML